MIFLNFWKSWFGYSRSTWIIFDSNIINNKSAKNKNYRIWCKLPPTFRWQGYWIICRTITSENLLSLLVAYKLGLNTLYESSHRILWVGFTSYIFTGQWNMFTLLLRFVWASNKILKIFHYISCSLFTMFKKFLDPFLINPNFPTKPRLFSKKYHSSMRDTLIND